MRKLIVSEFVTLDGVMEGPGPDDSFEQAGWTMPYASEEFMKFKLDELMASDTLLLGRVTYDGFATAWPGRTDESGFSDKMNEMKKYVVSTSLQKAKWNNSTIISGDVSERVAKLKADEGREILLFGSGLLVRSLMKDDLIDEFRLLVYPVVLGTGKRLFKENVSASLKLDEAQAWGSGVVLLRYSPSRTS